MSRSSFHGKINEIPGISVDNFEKQARAYFLSHCHSDHTQGLHTTVLLRTLEENRAYIYMSEQTAAVIDDEKLDHRLMDYVRPLKLGTTQITLPELPSQNLEELIMDVTLIPAGHSFGSVMFIFRTKSQTILFTGDFRISSNDISKYRHLHNNQGDPISIDTIYVDTTFMEDRYQNFPKRSTSIEYAIEEIKRWLEKDETNRVALHTSAKYGYEFVFNEIFKQLGLKVFVNEERWRFYSKLPDLIPGVTNEESRIHICRNRTETYNHTQCISDSKKHSYLYVHLSAMKWEMYEYEDHTFNRKSDNRLDVCFPTHCSRSELIYFIEYLNPKTVVGFPKEFQRSLKIEERCEVTPKKRRMNLPKKEFDRKVDRKLLDEIFEM